MVSSTQRLRAFFLRTVRTCPGVQVQDLRKGLYQAVMGCEHLFPAGPEALARAEAAIRAEAAALPAGSAAPETEALPGPWGRAHLSLLRAGLSPRTLAAAFLASGRQSRGRREDLAAGAALLTEMASAGELPFPAAAVEREVAQWRREGFPPCRHSEPYRQRCRPAYRVLLGRYLHLLPLLKELDALLAACPRVLLAVEGPCGSGKTTLAVDLERLYDAAVFHADDFFLRPWQRTRARLSRPGGNLDRERLEAEVLRPLRQGRAAVMRRYDCQKDALSPERTVPPRRLNVVEGVYSMHPALSGYYDASVFLSVSPAEQRRRLEKRCGTEGAAVFFRRWIPLEEAYFAACGTRERCTLRLEAYTEGDDENDENQEESRRT